jgi:hypothetical protein
MEFSRLIVSDLRSKPEQRIETRPDTPEIPPVRYDIERMDKALTEPGHLVPQGLSAAEILAFFDKISAEEE